MLQLRKTNGAGYAMPQWVVCEYYVRSDDDSGSCWVTATAEREETGSLLRVLRQSFDVFSRSRPSDREPWLLRM